MAAASNLYASTLAQALEGNIKWTTGTIKMALLSSSYSPALGTQVHYSDVSADEITGTGYTAGGATVPSPTATVTAANSWATTWAATTAYTYGQVVRPATGNGYLYMASTAGTSGSTAPSFPTVVGETVTDGTVVWTCMGESITVYSSGSVSWASSTITASYAVIYDATSGTTTTEPLINLQTFAASESDSNGTFVVAPDSVYGWFYTFPS